MDDLQMLQPQAKVGRERKTEAVRLASVSWGKLAKPISSLARPRTRARARAACGRCVHPSIHATGARARRRRWHHAAIGEGRRRRFDRGWSKNRSIERQKRMQE